MKCPECKVKMKQAEAKIDFHGEYRRSEYYICPKCESVYNILGELVTGSTNGVKLTFKCNCNKA